MARNTTLEELLHQYRVECRLSLNVAHNVKDRDRQVAHIQRTQTWLWEDFDWPILEVKRTKAAEAGQRFYSLPDDLKIDRLGLIEIYHAGEWLKMKPGIESEHYSAWNPELDERHWPPTRWRFGEDDTGANEQVEIWPLPSENGDLTTMEGVLRFTGIRNLKPLVADSDRADLDDRLIVLFCAAEILASRGDKDAPQKMQMANKRLLKLRGAQMPRKKFTLFGVGQPEPRRQRVPVAVYRSTG